jgi:hypothetical protein
MNYNSLLDQVIEHGDLPKLTDQETTEFKRTAEFLLSETWNGKIDNKTGYSVRTRITLAMANDIDDEDLLILMQTPTDGDLNKIANTLTLWPLWKIVNSRVSSQYSDLDILRWYGSFVGMQYFLLELADALPSNDQVILQKLKLHMLDLFYASLPEEQLVNRIKLKMPRLRRNCIMEQNMMLSYDKHLARIMKVIVEHT